MGIRRRWMTSSSDVTVVSAVLAFSCVTVLVSCLFCKKCRKKGKQRKESEQVEEVVVESSMKEIIEPKGICNVTYEDETMTDQGKEETEANDNSKTDPPQDNRSLVSTLTKSEVDIPEILADSNLMSEIYSTLDKNKAKTDGGLITDVSLHQQPPQDLPLPEQVVEEPSFTPRSSCSQVDWSSKSPLEESFRSIRQSVGDSFLFEGNDDPLSCVEESMKNYRNPPVESPDEDSENVVCDLVSERGESTETSTNDVTNDVAFTAVQEDDKSVFDEQETILPEDGEQASTQSAPTDRQTTAVDDEQETKENTNTIPKPQTATETPTEEASTTTTQQEQSETITKDTEITETFLQETQTVAKDKATAEIESEISSDSSAQGWKDDDATTNAETSSNNSDEKKSSTSDVESNVTSFSDDSFLCRHEGDCEWGKYQVVIFMNGWRRQVKLSDLVRLKLISCITADIISTRLLRYNRGIETQMPDLLSRFAAGGQPIAGILITEEERKESICRAAKDGYLRRGAAISLLEAQAATGSILDPITGRKMSLEVARQLGFVDRLHENVLRRAERAVVGYTSKFSKETMSLTRAMRRGLVMEAEVLRLLEVQLATGGIIDYATNLRLPVDAAVEHDVIDDELAMKLTYGDRPAGHFSDPNTEESLPYVELMKRCVLDEDTGFLLLPIKQSEAKMRRLSRYSVRSSLVTSRMNSIESIPALFKSNP